MANLRAVTAQVLPDAQLEHVVSTLLVGAVHFGYVTIRYENGRPTMVERHEQVRLTGREGRTPEPA